MGRKVSVALEADIGKFVAPVETAKKAVDDLGDKVDKLDRELDKIPPDAAKAAAAMKLLGGEADSAGQKIGAVGEKSTKLTLLDAKIRETRGEVRKLADEFVRTGDVDVFRKLGDAQGRLDALAKLRKDIAKPIEQGVTKGVLDGIGNAGQWEGLAPVAMHAGAAFAVPLLAAIGGALAGATGLAVAGGGLAGAILGNPERFMPAWSQALQRLKSEFLSATAPFGEAALEGISRIGPMVASWHLDKIFADAEKYADPLFDGIQDFSTGVVKGLGALVEKGGPAVHALSDGMTILGKASEDALGSIADGAQGGAYALKDLATGVGTVIRLFGQLTGAAEKAYEFIHNNPLLVGTATLGASIPFSAFTDANGNTKELRQTQYGARLEAEKLGHAFSAQGDDLTALSQKLNSATLSTDTLAAAMVNKLFTAVMNLDQAELGVNSSLLQVGQTFKDNGREIDKHTGLVSKLTEKGIANREAVLGAVSANQQLYQAQVAAGMSAEDAAAQYDKNTKRLEAQMRQAGLTQGQIDDLIGKYRDIPDTVNTQIAIEGLTTAINDLNHTLRLIAGLKDKDVYIRVHNQVYNETTGRRMTGNSRLGEDDRKYGGIRRAAEGMIVPPSSPGTLLFGEPETGGEAFIPLQGIPGTRAAMLGQIAMSGYGYSVVPQGAGGGMPRELVLHATFLDPHTGDVMRKQAFRWSLDRGRDPDDFFKKA